MTADVLRETIRTMIPLLSAVEAVSPGGPERKELAEFLAGCLKNGIQLNALLRAIESLPVRQ